MFELVQRDNGFHIQVEEKEQVIYQNVILKNGEEELYIPIFNNQVTIEEKHLTQWLQTVGRKQISVNIEYLYQPEVLNEETSKFEIVEYGGSKYQLRRRLLKPHLMELKVEGIESFIIEETVTIEDPITAEEMTVLQDVNVTPRFNNKGFFVIAFNKKVLMKDNYINRKITRLKIRNEELFIRNILTVRNFPIEKLYIQVESRMASQTRELEVTPKLLQRTKTKNGNKYQYEIEANAIKLVLELLESISSEVDEDNIDINWVYKQPGIIHQSKVRCGHPKIIVEQLMNGQISIRKDGKVHNFVPYFTVKGHNLSFFYNQYTNEEFEMYRKVVKQGKLKGNPADKSIWIVGERPYKAQDNGLRFFEFLRTQHPEIEAYYIIRKDSLERENVLPFGNVVDYRSKEHFDLITKADYICGTHHPDFLYPNRSKQLTKCIHAKQVFLQHGVLGVKNISGFYGKKMKDFKTELFITSSQIEKNIVMTDMGYEEHEVAITGLPRFERLLANDVAVKKQVLIIPTWRDWLTTSEKLLKSKYFDRYNSLVNDPRLLALKDEGVDILFCLHPNMQQFTDYFNVPSEITVIYQGDRLVQDLLKESALLITDYSSVAFDFSFLHKPVIYYQFDRKAFLGKYPSHLNLDEVLPGEIVGEHDALIEAIWQSYAVDFEMSGHYKKLANQFIQDRDTKSNERIYEAILNIPDKKPVVDVVKNHQVYTAAKTKFRKNKRYFPIMKLVYKLMSKTLKKDPKLIFFESGVGKQISDSPKVIYDELIKREADYKYIWVYNGIDPIKRSDTKVIKRLSPEYYYYLAKSKFWVNNQNFPFYIKKQKPQKYLQTWHGTPLKRMQNDVDDFKGKDSGYIGRVNAAVKQWDYLVSPSPYATKAFRSAFRFKKEVLEVGYPRNDIFYAGDKAQQDLINQVKHKYSIPEDKKVILYAPTFRDDDVNEKNKHQFHLQLDIEKMHELLGDDYVLLIRTHVVIGNKLVIPPELKDFAINASKYHDIQHLYLAADICMTDYSSVMFDFAHTKRPLLFFTYDLEHYRDNLRGFYMDLEEEAPGPLLMDSDEVIQSIQNIDEIQLQYKEKYQAFYNKYCSLENGEAAKKIVDRFFK